MLILISREGLVCCLDISVVFKTFLNKGLLTKSKMRTSCAEDYFGDYFAKAIEVSDVQCVRCACQTGRFVYAFCLATLMLSVVQQ